MKLDIKSITIIVLGVALIVSFFFGQGNSIDYHKAEIKDLHDANAILTSRNDSLFTVNKALDSKIDSVSKLIDANGVKLANTQKELDKLKNKKNETSIYVNRLSANGVSNALSDYLKNRPKGADNR